MKCNKIKELSKYMDQKQFLKCVWMKDFSWSPEN